MKGYYSKKLQKNSKLYAELQENIKLYINHSINKESKQKSYLQHTAFLNPKTGEYLNIQYDFEKKYKEYSRISEQRALTIQELARRNEFCSVFITLTLPSHFHPFKSIATKQGRLYVEENKDFAIVTTGKDFVKLKEFNIKNLYLMDLDINISQNVDFSLMEEYINSINK